MITVLTGENSYEINEALQEIVRNFKGTPEQFDGSTIELRQLPDLLMGGTLFAQQRLIILKGIMENAIIKAHLTDWLDRVDDTTHLVLIDEKLDKRTALYKDLKKKATVREFTAWSDRDSGLAIKWLTQKNPRLDRTAAEHLVRRVGLDQWQLASAMSILENVESITPQSIDEYIQPNVSENVFQLFELALEGKSQRVHDMLKTLEISEDPYAVFALLSSQVFQLAAVGLAESGDNPTKEAAIHPFVASKLQKHAKARGPRGVMAIVQTFADADADLKRSRGEPWLVIEKSLQITAQ